MNILFLIFLVKSIWPFTATVNKHMCEFSKIINSSTYKRSLFRSYGPFPVNSDISQC